MFIKKIKWAKIILAFMIFFSNMSSQAVDIYWTNSTVGNFTNANNWLPNSVPTIIDTAIFTNNVTYTVNLTSSPTSFRASFSGASAINNLNIANGQTWSVAGYVLIGLAGDNVTLNLTNSGTWHLTIANENLYVGYQGSGTLNHNAGIVRGTGMNIGAAGYRGTVNIAGGTNLINFVNIAPGANSTGNVLVTSGHLMATNSGMFISQSGIGTLTISNGLVKSFETYIAFSTGGTGTLAIAGGIYQMTGNGFIAGYAAGSTGSVVVSGGQFLNTNANTIFGYSGAGALNISGGNALLKAGYLGYDLNSKGTLIMTGGTNEATSVLYLGSLARSTGIVVMSGGTLITPIVYSGSNDVTKGRGIFLITNGAIMEVNSMIAGLNSTGTISNRQAIYQFTTASPIITNNTANAIVITNGIISYRAVNNASVIVSNQTTNITYQGANTFRLNSSTNDMLSMYTFTNYMTLAGATNYVYLELINSNSRWHSTNLTIGVGATLLSSNGNQSARIVSGGMRISGQARVTSGSLTLTK